MTILQLLASLALTNNGYLFAPLAAELATARANPDVFVVTPAGTIYPRATPPKLDAIPRPAVTFKSHDGFDYEGAILARQEAAGFYD